MGVFTDLENEKWKSVSLLSYLTPDEKEHLAYYEISNMGRAYNKKTGNMLKLSHTNTDCHCLFMRHSYKGEKLIKQIAINKAVLELFVPNPHNKESRVFIDDDVTNLRASNLRYEYSNRQKKEIIRNNKKLKNSVDGKLCILCGNFKKYDDIYMSIDNGKPSHYCKLCALILTIDKVKNSRDDRDLVKFIDVGKYIEKEFPDEQIIENDDGTIAVECCDCDEIFSPTKNDIIRRLYELKNDMTHNDEEDDALSAHTMKCPHCAYLSNEVHGNLITPKAA